MAEQAQEQQDRGMFGLFGKKEEEGRQDDQITQTPATHTHNEAQTEAASYYPTSPHEVEHGSGHGYEGQLTPEEAEQQKHKGLVGKIHRTHSSSSSSSSDEEEEGGKKKEGERKKKGSKDKTKEKLPSGGQHSSDQCAGEEEKKAGMVDKIKEKLPGHQEKLPAGGQHSSDQCGSEEEKKKTGLLDKIKDKLPGHQEKLPGGGQHSSDQYGGEEEEKKRICTPKEGYKYPLSPPFFPSTAPLDFVNSLPVISSGILTKLFTYLDLFFESFSINMAEQAPEHQDRGMFGLFGKKKEEEGRQDDQITQTPATYTHNEAQTEAASYYPTSPHEVEHGPGHGHEGQLTPEEAEQQKHKGLVGKLHRTHSSSSSSSSDEEEEGGKKKEVGRKKKGAKDKTKEKLPSGGHHSSDHSSEEKKKAGMVDKIKEKLPGHQEKLPAGGEHSSDQYGGKQEKKMGLLDKIKEKLPGHENKNDGEEEEKKHPH